MSSAERRVSLWLLALIAAATLATALLTPRPDPAVVEIGRRTVEHAGPHVPVGPPAAVVRLPV